MIANVRIGATEIGALNAPLIVAEMSGNHNQSLQKALELVDEAANAGAHAIKLQTYTADSMTLDRSEGLFYIDDENSLWYGKTLYELYQQASTPWEWHEAIFARAKEKNIEIFSSPFSDEAVEFLEKLGAPAYKIASFENNHWQ